MLLVELKTKDLRKMPKKGGRYYDDRRSHKSKKESRRKGDSSTESDDDVEGRQQCVVSLIAEVQFHLQSEDSRCNRAHEVEDAQRVS